MIGISISLYDRFEELAILTDIIRENWNKEYYVVACSNHPDAENRVRELDIDLDELIPGDQIDFNPEMTGLRGHVNLICRVYDTIRKPCTEVIEHPEVEHVMHLHADAWPLSEERVLELVKEMDDRDKPVAFKGYGLGRRGVFPIGHVMDQFFVIDAEYAQSVDFFEHSALELLPDRGIHTIMMLILLGKVGWSNVYFYSDGSEQVYWDGADNFGVGPMMYNPDWEYVHVKPEDFPDELGKTVQATYLANHGVTEGPHIEPLIEEYACPHEELVAKLNETESKYNNTLRWYGLSLAEDFDRNYGKADEFLDRSLSGRLKTAAGKQLLPLSQGVASLKEVIGEKLGITASLPAADPVAEAWPERNLDEVYGQELCEEDFPDEDQFWFVNDV